MSLVGKKSKQKSDAAGVDSAESVGSAPESPAASPSALDPPAAVEQEPELSFGEIPDQVDRPSYEELLEAAQKRRSFRVRQIRARAPNDTLVAGVFVSPRWAVISLERVLDMGRSYLRQLANDKTIEVHLVEE